MSDETKNPPPPPVPPPFPTTPDAPTQDLSRYIQLPPLPSAPPPLEREEEDQLKPPSICSIWRALIGVAMYAEDVLPLLAT
jgi:hypothetical protein